MPTPIEEEDAEIVAPVLPPDAAEIQPRGADPLRAFAPLEAPEAYHLAESLDPAQEYVPDVADPVRQLGASALSTASLEAAGAPTPRGGVPLIGGDGDVVPSFGDEEPFVPRFEPLGGVVPAPVPTVSFTTPRPTTPPVSPLSDVAIPESDGPAYAPREEFLDTQSHASSGDLFPARGDEPPADATTAETFAPPARPWAAVDPTEVEFVGGEPLSVEVGAFGSETPEPVVGADSDAPDSPFTPTAPSWEGIIGGEDANVQTPVSYEIPVTVAPGRFPPVVDAADPAVGPVGDVTEVEAADVTEVEVADAASSEGGEVAGVTAAGGEMLTADATTDDFAPDPSWPSTEAEAAVGADAGQPEAPDLAVPAETPVTPIAPVTPAASFFAATATRSARRAEDATGATPEVPAGDWAPSVDSEPVEVSKPMTAPTAAFGAAPIPKEPIRTEPVRTTATAYTPSTGAWARPAFAPADAVTADAVTQVNAMAPIGDTHDTGSSGSAALPAGSPSPTATVETQPADASVAKVHKRRRLVLWIVLGVVVAAAAAFLVYRLYFMPEPVVLPAPTATAQAATPTAKPIEITNASAFVTSMPTTVGTNVLIDYTVTDTVGDSTLPARTAEHVTLDYGPGSSSRVFTVEAYQHYDQTDAQTAYDSYAAGMTDVKDVVVDGATVGKRAYSASGSKGTVVWRNGTAVFDLTGPASEVLGFFEHFGV